MVTNVEQFERVEYFSKPLYILGFIGIYFYMKFMLMYRLYM